MFCKKEPVRMDLKIESPIIKAINIDVKTHGKYKTKSGNPMGLVIHYTAGRSHNIEKDAVNTLNTLAYGGLGCMVMDTMGVIYRAQNQAMDDVAFHCGPSEWKGKKGISYYCMGMEICSAGVLKYQDEKYKSWFGQEYFRDEIREILMDDHNWKTGYYHKFTREQEQSLKAFIKWQKNINPEFDLDWVVGHDEICIPKGRKLDPGGCLSLPMDLYRAALKT
jgi:N-acetyl-anhydromuramyl-L-alanine amidase AmpD